MFRSRDQTLSILAINALANLCHYSDDIKEIFFQKGGLNLMLENLNSMQNEILTAILTLLLTFISKSEQFSKKISSENNYECVTTLLNILKGIDLPCTDYSPKVKYLTVAALRQMIKYSEQVKRCIMFEKHAEPLKCVIQMVYPENLTQLPVYLEINIYQYLFQLIQEEIENKSKIGELIMIPVFHNRLLAIKEKKKSSEFQDHQAEENFFKLLKFLVYNCTENARILKDKRIDS